MAHPRDLRSYPQSFFSLAQAFCDGTRDSIPLAFASEGLARYTAQKFYTFRKLLLASAEANAYAQLRALTIRREGTTLHFENIDFAGGDIEAQLRAQGIAAFAPAMPAAPVRGATQSEGVAALASEVSPEEAASRFEETLRKLGYT